MTATVLVWRPKRERRTSGRLLSDCRLLHPSSPPHMRSVLVERRTGCSISFPSVPLLSLPLLASSFPSLPPLSLPPFPSSLPPSFPFLSSFPPSFPFPFSPSFPFLSSSPPSFPSPFSPSLPPSLPPYLQYTILTHSLPSLL